MKSKFLCPLPWTSLSFQAQSKPRLCCHQAVSSDALSVKNISEAFSLEHNSRIRQQMLDDQVPQECLACHRLEAAGCRSPRQEYLETFAGCNYKDIKISYLELTVDNNCNLQCAMCSPFYSVKLSKIFSSLYDSPPIKSWSLAYKEQDILELLPQIEYLTLTGGEPFVSKNILNLIKMASTSGYAKNIVLRIFSNLTSLPPDLASILQPFKKVELFLSIDAVGDCYEKIRYPAKWPQVCANIKLIQNLKMKNVDLNIHSVIMAETWLGLAELIDFYNTELDLPHSVVPAFVEIAWPSILHPGILPADVLKAGYDAAIARAAFYAKKKNLPSQVVSLDNLLTKIKGARCADKAIDNKIFWARLSRARNSAKDHEK